MVWVDGQRVSELGTKVDPNCDIRLDTQANRQQQERVTVLLRKPVGYVGTAGTGLPTGGGTDSPGDLWQDGRAGLAFHPTHLEGARCRAAAWIRPVCWC